ncbi:LIM domain-binding protein 2 [Chelonia mydas]|uniref:LIM domain-binding protein 2 n=1 Tax=Chelonia mydas TaxID=8469 RepID=M7BRV8_CHEMY|nr:LIM domain-binding protein 2 [Chelonia mydas]
MRENHIHAPASTQAKQELELASPTSQVCTEGRLILEFTFDDLMRIKTWHFTIRQYRELVPRSILAMHAQDPQVLEQLSKNITRMGLTNFTLNYLRVRATSTPLKYRIMVGSSSSLPQLAVVITHFYPPLIRISGSKSSSFSLPTGKTPAT